MASSSFRTRFGSISNINWFPGHMATAKKQIQLQLSNVDIVLEVRDARLPFTSANPMLDDICRLKKRMIVFNKADLANSNMQKRVQDHLKNDLDIESLFINATKTKHCTKIIDWCKQNTSSQFQTTGGTIIMIMGIPNVGKSSLINQMRKLANTSKFSSGPARALVGNMPGVTRRTDMIRINHRPALFVIDTPGIMIPKLDSTQVGLQLALTGAIKDTIVGIEVIADYMLYVLNTMGSELYVSVLGLEGPTDDIEVLFEAVVEKSGGVGKEVSVQRQLAAKYLVAEFRLGNFGLFTLDTI